MIRQLALGAIGLAALLCLVIGTSACAQASAAPPKTTTQPTATLQPSIGNVATIGGIQAAFSTRFGNPVAKTSITATYQNGNTRILAAFQTALDTQARVILLRILPVDPVLTLQLLPRDAMPTMTTAGGEHIYSSALLAALFPRAAFVALSTGALVAPGSVSWICVNATNSCDIGIGTQ